jgi:hypothetical protein
MGCSEDEVCCGFRARSACGIKLQIDALDAIRRFAELRRRGIARRG